MLAKHPDEAPASLVIVVDEFATLVKEIPDFVAGIVDIAQRGRSLGIHLVLATQRPSGSVNDNILANTNLRLSLRMLDRAESTAVIDSPEAADIPVPLRGRGYARLGPRELVAVPVRLRQRTADRRPTTRARPWSRTSRSSRSDEPDRGARPRRGAPAMPATRPTHLDARARRGRRRGRAVPLPAGADAVARGAARARHRRRAAGRRPRSVGARAAAPAGCCRSASSTIRSTRTSTPRRSTSRRAAGCIVFGSGGSGRTTLLRTIAATAALRDVARRPRDLRHRLRVAGPAQHRAAAPRRRHRHR